MEDRQIMIRFHFLPLFSSRCFHWLLLLLEFKLSCSLHYISWGKVLRKLKLPVFPFHCNQNLPERFALSMQIIIKSVSLVNQITKKSSLIRNRIVQIYFVNSVLLRIKRCTKKGRETNGGSPSALRHFPADIWRFGRLAFGLLAPGTFPGQDFWLLDIRRWDIWRLEIWRPRQMAAKTIGGRDNPCPGRLASWYLVPGTIGVWDISRLGQTPPRHLASRDIWRPGLLAVAIWQLGLLAADIWRPGLLAYTIWRSGH